MSTGEESERMAWDMEVEAHWRRLGGQPTRNPEARRRQFMEEQEERRLSACAATVARRAAFRLKVGSFLVTLVSLVVLVITSLPD